MPSVRYGSLLNYSPRGKSEVSRKSQHTCAQIKSGRPDVITRVVELVGANYYENGLYKDFFGPETVFVPVPGSSIMLPSGSIWIPRLIADEFVKQGLGVSVVPYLKRVVSVSKSSFAAPGQRPTVKEHFKSIAIDAEQVQLFKPNTIVLIDDVLTKGRTIFASYARLRTVFADTPVLSFSAMRTQGLIPNIDRLVDPSVGEISWDGDESRREP